MARVGRKPSVCAGGSGNGNLRIVKVYHIAIGALLRIPAQCHGIRSVRRRNPLGNPGSSSNRHGGSISAGALGIIGTDLERVGRSGAQPRECFVITIYPVRISIKFYVVAVGPGNWFPDYGCGICRGALCDSSRSRQARRGLARLARRKRRDFHRGTVGSRPVHVLSPHRIGVRCLLFQTVYGLADRCGGRRYCMNGSVKVDLVAACASHLIKAYRDRGNGRNGLDIPRHRQGFVDIEI